MECKKCRCPKCGDNHHCELETPKEPEKLWKKMADKHFLRSCFNEKAIQGITNDYLDVFEEMVGEILNDCGTSLESGLRYTLLQKIREAR